MYFTVSSKIVIGVFRWSAYSIKDFVSFNGKGNFVALTVTGELMSYSNGKMNWKSFLKKFWKDFHGNTSKVMDTPFPEVLEVLNQKVGHHIFGRDEKGNLKCPICEATQNRFLRLKIIGSMDRQMPYYRISEGEV